MAAVYPEDLLPPNVIVPLSEGTERGRVGTSEGSGIPGLSGPYSAVMRHDTDSYNQTDDLLAAVLAEARQCRVLLTEIRDIATAVKIPNFLRHGK